MTTWWGPEVSDLWDGNSQELSQLVSHAYGHGGGGVTVLPPLDLKLLEARQLVLVTLPPLWCLNIVDTQMCAQEGGETGTPTGPPNGVKE